ATSKKTVTKKPTRDESDDEQEGRLTKRRPIGVVIKDTPNVSTKKTMDQSQKLKGVEVLLDVAYIHDDDEKHDDTDEEMNDVENADELKDDQVIDDAEKVDSKKTEEKKVDIEQVGDDKVEDDQVGSLISMTHNEKPEVPTSSFKLSLSFNYGNKLLNLSSDTSLVG
ncbi:hypothetical protein Tco_1127828, partial [Tanacetum coccineum]